MGKSSEEEILSAAWKIFAKKGYHGSSVSDITNEAGVSKALFYHYFGSKKDLLVIFAKKRLEAYLKLADGLERIESQKDRLEFLVDFVLDELEKETEKLRFLNMLYLTEDGVLAIEEALKKYEKQFAKLFQAEKKLFSDLGFSEPELEATYMRSLLQGVSLEYMLGPKEYPLQEIKTKILSRYKKENL